MHTGPSGVKGGNKPQSTPHPSYAHKNSMSSSPPWLPHSVPSTSLSLLRINRLTLHGSFPFCFPSMESQSSSYLLSKLMISWIFLHIETQNFSVKQHWMIYIIPVMLWESFLRINKTKLQHYSTHEPQWLLLCSQHAIRNKTPYNIVMLLIANWSRLTKPDFWITTHICNICSNSNMMSISTDGGNNRPIRALCQLPTQLSRNLDELYPWKTVMGKQRQAWIGSIQLCKLL